MPNRRVLPLLRSALVVAFVALCYFATGRLLLTLSAPPNGAVITVWLPSGITVASLILFGPCAAAGSFLGSIALDLSVQTPLAGALIVGVANAGSELLCYYLIVGRDRQPLSIVETRSLLRLLLASVACATLSACIGVTAYVSYGVLPDAVYWSSWLVWFGSTLIGVILLTPFLVYAKDLYVAVFKGGRGAECAIALAALAGAAFFWQGFELPYEFDEPLVLIVILVLLWMAFRFPPAAMPLAIFFFSVPAIAGAVLRIGQGPRSTEFLSIFTLQVMLGGVSMIGYILASIVAAQKRANDELRLAAKVYDTTNDGIIVTAPDGIIIDVNNAFGRMTGYRRGEMLGKKPSFIKSDRQPPESFRIMQEAVTATGEWQGEVWYRRADGSDLPAWLSISAVKKEDGVTTEHVGIFSDITELREAQNELMSAARRAGMAEIANNVLHNVGNVLNSVNISAGLVASKVRSSKLRGISRAMELVNRHAGNLGDFLTRDEKGKLLPAYLGKLAVALEEEQESIVEELERLTRSIDHIKGIIATQQSYAGASSVTEQVQIRQLVEDALAAGIEMVAGEEVTVLREFQEAPVLPLDKARVLLILVNLISNARHALEEVAERSRRLKLGVDVVDGRGGRRLRIRIEDNGVGIAAGDLDRIFSHGFTTRKNGHGFGLHSCALAADEMGGTLTAQSDGPGKGAVFTLELPVPSLPS